MASQYWVWLVTGALEGSTSGMVGFPDDWDAQVDVGYVKSVHITSGDTTTGELAFNCDGISSQVDDNGLFDIIYVQTQFSPYTVVIENPWVVTEGYFGYSWNGADVIRIILEVEVKKSATNTDLALVTFGTPIFDNGLVHV